MRLSLAVAPMAEPVSLQEAKDHLRVVRDAENDLILRQLRAAREMAETYSRRQFCEATWDGWLDNWPSEQIGLRPDGRGGYRGGDIILPKAPLVSVTHVKYYDTDGVEQTFSATKYNVETADGEPGRITVAYGEEWPDVQLRPSAINIRWVAGYGEPADVPQVAKEAILLLLGARYAQREAVAAPIGGRYEELPLGFKALLDSIRVLEVR